MSALDKVELSFPNGGKHTVYYRDSSASDKQVLEQIFYAKNYSIKSFKMAARLYKYALAMAGAKRLLIVDAGANIGASSVFFSFWFPGSKTIAIEPEKNNFELLKLNTEGLEVVPIESAIDCEPGTIFIQDPGLGDWGFRTGKEGSHAVKAITMDEILTDYKEADFLPFICKIDIEGGEGSLFRKNYAWMDKFPLIIIELHDWMLPGEGNARNFMKALLEFNFDFVFRGEDVFCFNNRLLKDFA